jgi:hypothetical protein
VHHTLFPHRGTPPIGGLGTATAHHTLGEAVKDHREKYDTQASRDTLTDIKPRNAAEYFLTEPLSTDHRGNNDHGKCEHDGLIDAGNDRRKGEWQLDLCQKLPASGPERVACLDEVAWDLFDAKRSQANGWWGSKNEGGDEPRHVPDAKEEHSWDQVHEEWHRLHEIKHGVENVIERGEVGLRHAKRNANE